MKRITFLHVYSLVMLQVVAQTKTVSIHGVVKDTTVKSVEISHLLDDQLSKWENTKVNVINGEFSKSIIVPFPVDITITIGNRLYRKNYIYTDAKVLIDTARTLHLVGSPIQDEYENEFLPFFQSNDKVYDSLMSFNERNYPKYGNGLPKFIQDSAILLKAKYCYQRSELLNQYIKRYPDSYVALWDIYFFVSLPSTHKYFDFEKLFSAFSSQMQHTSFMNVLKEKIKESEKMQVGQLFPKDFFKGYEQMQSNIEKNNRYYLIDFWYSHCNPCVKGFPKLKEIYHQFHGKGFDIVSISVDKKKDEKDYLTAIKRNGLAWNHVWDKDGLGAEKFNINSFPTYILLDKNGSIINAKIQDSELETFLKEHLGSL